jgi:ABC-type glycerol-3-phosphate transport system permease component
VYRLAIHLTLIVGSIIFSMPFVWMISCSLKEDDEQMTEQLVWFPRLPPYQPRSPFIDNREGIALMRPPEILSDRWAALQPAVMAALDERVNAVKLDTGGTPEQEAKVLLRAALWRDLVRRIPSDKFADEASLREAIAETAIDEQVRQSHWRVYRAVALTDITLRAEGESEVRIPARQDSKPDGELVWKLAPSSGGADVSLQQNSVENKPMDELRYGFGSVGERARVTAIVPFGEKAPPKAINIGIKSDSSWNRVWFAIEFGGKRYEAIEPSLLGGMGRLFSELLYQLPSPEDNDDMRIRHWLLSQEMPANPAYHNQPGTVKVELAIENTSFATKVYDKATYNYKNSLRYIPFWRYMLTSLFLVAINIVLTVFSTSLIAFAFARLNWPGRGICWAIVLGTVMIPGQVTMIPTFLIMKWLGWYNTLRPLWIGSAFGSVFFIFMLRQFMKNIPKDLEDAAKIDGCSYWQIYWHVILPLVKPTLAAISIFTFMGVWNNFMGPLMYLSDQKLYPLSLGLFAFQTLAGGNQGMMMAASLMMTLPVIALFFVAQKQFIQGVTFTGIKG